MLYLGCHLSSAAGFAAMGKTALKINANTFQFFLRNPRGGAAKDIKPADVSEFLALAKQNGFGKILAHAPYTLNPCSKDTSVREFAGEVFADDLKRMENLPGNLYNFHPGSHVGQGIAVGCDTVDQPGNCRRYSANRRDFGCRNAGSAPYNGIIGNHVRQRQRSRLPF